MKQYMFLLLLGSSFIDLQVALWFRCVNTLVHVNFYLLKFARCEL